MRTAFVTTWIVTLATAFSEFELMPQNLEKGVLVKGSESSKNVGLYCVHRGLTTGTLMVLMKQEREKVLAVIPILTTYSSPRPPQQWLDIRWNAAGSAVAIHDSSSAKSALLIYHVTEDGQYAAVNVAGARSQVASLLDIQLEKVKTSGERPVRWKNEKTIEVEFRYRMKDGKRLSHRATVTFDGRWKPALK